MYRDTEYTSIKCASGKRAEEEEDVGSGWRSGVTGNESVIRYRQNGKMGKTAKTAKTAKSAKTHKNTQKRAKKGKKGSKGPLGADWRAAGKRGRLMQERFRRELPAANQTRRC